MGAVSTNYETGWRNIKYVAQTAHTTAIQCQFRGEGESFFGRLHLFNGGRGFVKDRDFILYLPNPLPSGTEFTRTACSCQDNALLPLPSV